MPSFLDKFALGGIKCYQKFISPLKGWRCAYGVTHGQSCSAIATDLIKEHGALKARPMIRQQFTDCQAEYERLKAQSNSRNSDCCDRNGGCDAPTWGCAGMSVPNNGCDIGGCDIGGCDF